jgi:hypothetical protein
VIGLDEKERLCLYQAAMKLCSARNSMVMRGMMDNDFEIMRMVNDIATMLDRDEEQKKEENNNDEKGNT